MRGESEVPGGALNLISTNHPDHGHHGRLPLSRKNAHGRAGNRTRYLMVSSQELWPPSHEAGPWSPTFPTRYQYAFFFVSNEGHMPQQSNSAWVYPNNIYQDYKVINLFLIQFFSSLLKGHPLSVEIRKFCYITVNRIINTGCPTRYRSRLAGGPLLRVTTIMRTTDTHYRHIPFHFLHNEPTPVQISLQYLHWC